MKDKVLNYIENVLEVPRDEYNGMPTCPFALCINPNDKLEVDGFNARSLAPCFLVLINDKKDIYYAHKSMKDTKYYDKMDLKYKKYLGI